MVVGNRYDDKNFNKGGQKLSVKTVEPSTKCVSIIAVIEGLPELAGYFTHCFLANYPVKHTLKIRQR